MGLRVTRCMSSPEIPWAAPASRAKSVRGTRVCTTLAAKASWPGANRAEATSGSGIEREPTASESPAARTVSASSTATAHATRTREAKGRASPWAAAP